MAKKPKPASEFDRDAEGPEVREREAGEGEPGEQLKLLDTDHPARKDLLRLARAIRKLDAERGESQTKANEKRAELRELMHEHKLPSFICDDVEVTLKPERVSVKQRGEESPSGDAD